jgi:hypothetical protein
MSLSSLIQNIKKLWLNIRVNDITVDGTIATAAGVPIEPVVLQTIVRSYSSVIRPTGIYNATDGPTISGGQALDSIVVTPKSNNSFFILEWSAPLGMVTGSTFVAALFNLAVSTDPIAASFSYNSSGLYAQNAFCTSYPNVTTSPITFDLRIGVELASAVAINGLSNGAAMIGGTTCACLKITEVTTVL